MNLSALQDAADWIENDQMDDKPARIQALLARAMIMATPKTEIEQLRETVAEQEEEIRALKERIERICGPDRAKDMTAEELFAIPKTDTDKS